MTVNDYDKVPYESYPYSNSHPDNLYTIGKLFGMKPALPKKSRVLELGCASGGNIIPMAVKYPNSEFVGIDLSNVQIEEGNKHVKNLGITNLQLKTMSIMDINKKFGKFDYIIAHGILSWVPKDVQNKVFEVCSNNLNEKGIAYISYNTLPGWNMVKSIREMMLYHTARFTDPSQKVQEACKLLNFIKEGNTNGNSAYLEMIKNEIQLLQQHGGSYLLHDHLEENNEPIYFHEFAESAKKTGLQYLGETSIGTMFIGNFPKETSDILMQVNNDIVRVEQYMDFVTNRRFRSTLLCHKDVVLNRNFMPGTIKDFYVSAFVFPTKPVDLTSNEPVTFVSKNGDINFATDNRAVVAALLYLSEQKDFVAVKKILLELNKRIGAVSNPEVVENTVLHNLLRLVLAGMPVSAFPTECVAKVSLKPKVSDIARYQATYSSWVTNQRSEHVNVDTFGRVLCQYLNGENDFDAIVSNMVQHVVNDELTLNKNGKKITDKKEIEKDVRNITNALISQFVPNSLLVA
jgi:methyltransferase-like protein/SAM-dependent methyltransferase